ncbi:unnamed protein product, partial [Phaeothamnion confervicola]
YLLTCQPVLRYVRLCLCLGFLFLLIWSLLGVPSSHNQLGPGIPPDGVFYATINVVINGYLFLRLLWESRPINFGGDERKAGFWRACWRRAGISRIDFLQVLRAGEWKSYKAGEVIQEEAIMGHPEYLHFLYSGLAWVVPRSDGFDGRNCTTVTAASAAAGGAAAAASVNTTFRPTAAAAKEHDVAAAPLLQLGGLAPIAAASGAGASASAAAAMAAKAGAANGEARPLQSPTPPVFSGKRAAESVAAPASGGGGGMSSASGGPSSSVRGVNGGASGSDGGGGGRVGYPGGTGNRPPSIQLVYPIEIFEHSIGRVLGVYLREQPPSKVVAETDVVVYRWPVRHVEELCAESGNIANTFRQLVASSVLNEYQRLHRTAVIIAQADAEYAATSVAAGTAAAAVAAGDNATASGGNAAVGAGATAAAYGSDGLYRNFGGDGGINGDGGDDYGSIAKPRSSLPTLDDSNWGPLYQLWTNAVDTRPLEPWEDDNNAWSWSSIATVVWGALQNPVRHKRGIRFQPMPPKFRGPALEDNIRAIEASKRIGASAFRERISATAAAAAATPGSRAGGAGYAGAEAGGGPTAGARAEVTAIDVREEEEDGGGVSPMAIAGPASVSALPSQLYQCWRR